MRNHRATTAHTTKPQPCPACTTRAAAEADKPPRFEPYKLANRWAAGAGLFGDATDKDHGVVVRRDRYGQYVPVNRAELRRQLADFSAAQGWPTEHPAGRLDVLENAARDLVCSMYRAPISGAGEVDPLAPPPQWARRGEQNALPPWWYPRAVAEVFVAEWCYSEQGRTLAQIAGSLQWWNHRTGQWETWGTYEPAKTIVTGENGSVVAVGRNLTDTLRDFVRGQHYWDDTTDTLTPFTQETVRVKAEVEAILTWGTATKPPPAGPGEVAALDHQRATDAAQRSDVHFVYERDGITTSTPLY